MNKIKELYARGDVAPIIRRYFINTLFDSTFTLLGIIVGAAFITNGNLEILLVTMLTGSLALGISTGVSVYEAETLEREKSVMELERAMLTNLEGTSITESSRSVILLASLMNFATPLIACGITIAPFVLVSMGVLDFKTASLVSVVLAFGILFSAGVYLGRLGKQNPWLKGLRMVGFGLLAFFIGYFLESIIT